MCLEKFSVLLFSQCVETFLGMTGLTWQKADMGVQEVRCYINEESGQLYLPLVWNAISTFFKSECTNIGQR